MQEKIKQLIKEALKNLNLEEVNFVVEHPEDFNNGDYSTNVAMVQNLKKLETKELKFSRIEIADMIGGELNRIKNTEIEKIDVAGPGFINFYLSQEFFTDSIKEILEQKESWGKNNLLSGKKVMVEYTDPNPFKPFHIGHLMANAVGESISRIVEFSGAKTIRANYQGDVGLHVAKAILGIEIRLKIDQDILNKIKEKFVQEQAQFIGYCYALGSGSFEWDNREEFEKMVSMRNNSCEGVEQKGIHTLEYINKVVYEKSDPEINKIYDWGIDITMKAFDSIYKILGTEFNKNCYFLESKMAPIGEKIVRENIGKIFEESDGAIIFHGEKYDPKLHTRVFINSQGLPTYETKEVGLTITKFEKENLDISIVTTAVEQAEYMKVVEEAIYILYPNLKGKMKHITHGMMRFADGKMSSRKGNVITGESLINDSMDMIREKIVNRDLNDDEKNTIAKQVGISALKYSILKSSIGSDIIYDFEKSISFEGDSGPYLQYTAVRANSILKKALEEKFISSEHGYFSAEKFLVLVPSRSQVSAETNFSSSAILERLLFRFPEVVERSYQEFAPHYIATYLTELASIFNSFYGNTKILDVENKYINYHLNLVQAFYQTMKNGLWLLGIEIPEKM